MSNYVNASITMPNAQQMGNNFTSGLSNITQQSPTKQPSNFVEMKSQNDQQNIQDASNTRAGADNNATSNSQANYTPTAAGPEIPLDLYRVNVLDGGTYQYYEVGTTVNKKNPIGGSANKFQGTPAIMNNYYLIRYHSLNDNTTKLPNQLGVAEGNEDYKGLASDPLYKNPTTSIIVKTFNGKKSESYFGYPEKVYTYSDFLYLKDYNPYGNNKLITLRRFMAPVYDECRLAIKTADNEFRKPIAKALTYLNDSNKLSELTKMSVGFPIGDATGNIEGATTVSNNKTDAGAIAQKVTGGLDQSKIAQTSGEYGLKLFSILSGATDAGLLQKWTSAYDPWASGGTLQDLVYGPINVITGSKIRQRGLTFSQSNFDVKFAYSLKAIEKINPKAAMLDILSNMLALTYNHAMFWGGENRYIIDRSNFPLVQPEVVFRSLSELKRTGSNIDAMKEAGGNVASSATNATESFKALFDSLLKSNNQADVQGSMKSIFDTAITALTGKESFVYDIFSSVLSGTNQILTGSPTGEWHLQVGNPFAPIMMIGNLWCTSTSFEFNDEFSVDDFPTELSFSCTLQHGRNRDASDIQSIFNAGGGRIYYPYKDAKKDVNASSATFNSEPAFVFNPDNVLGSWNRTTVDRNGFAIDSILKKGDPNESTNVARHIVQTVSDYTGKNTDGTAAE